MDELTRSSSGGVSHPLTQTLELITSLEGIVGNLMRAGEALKSVEPSANIRGILSELNGLSKKLHIECNSSSNIIPEMMCSPEPPPPPAGRGSKRQPRRRPPLSSLPHNRYKIPAEAAEKLLDRQMWRKYGEKPIKNSSFKRSYFRCSHSKTHGCQAKRYIQKCNPNELEIVHVNHHTCGFKLSPVAAQGNVAAKPVAYDLHQQLNARYADRENGVESTLGEAIAGLTADLAAGSNDQAVEFEIGDEDWPSPLSAYWLSECDVIERRLRECSGEGSVDSVCSDVSSSNSDNDGVNYCRQENSEMNYITELAPRLW